MYIVLWMSAVGIVLENWPTIFMSLAVLSFFISEVKNSKTSLLLWISSLYLLFDFKVYDSNVKSSKMYNK